MELTPPRAAVRLALADGLARITLAAPERGNALGPGLLGGLAAALRRAAAAPGCRALVLEAEGEHFCKGLDFDTALEPGADSAALTDGLLECLLLIRRAPQPVIACVGAPASGGGVGLAAACDLVLAGDAASFALPEAIVGLGPVLIAPFLLRRIAPARLGYMALSTRALSPAEAHACGLADELAGADLAGALRRQLQRLFRCSPAALAAYKQYLEQLQGDTLQRQIERARAQMAALLADPETQEGLRLFAEGLTPPWFQKYRGTANG